MLVITEHEARNKPSWALLCNIKREATEGSSSASTFNSLEDKQSPELTSSTTREHSIFQCYYLPRSPVKMPSNSNTEVVEGKSEKFENQRNSSGQKKISFTLAFLL